MERTERVPFYRGGVATADRQGVIQGQDFERSSLFLPGGGRRRRRRAREERIDPLDELVRVEGLRDDHVAADPVGALPVEGLEGSGEQDHGDARGGRIALDRFADLVTVLLRHHDVGEDEVRPRGLERFDRLPSVGNAGQLVARSGKRQLDDFLDRQAVVGQQDLFAHEDQRTKEGGRW